MGFPAADLSSKACLRSTRATWAVYYYQLPRICFNLCRPDPALLEITSWLEVGIHDCFHLDIERESRFVRRGICYLLLEAGNPERRQPEPDTSAHRCI